MSIEIAMKKNGFPRLVTTQLGMGLVEILVGLVIGLIGVLVIFQTMAVWGERTATTVSGGDSRTSGAIGMHYLAQDLAQGGLGFGRTDAPGRQFVPGCYFTAAGGNFRLAAVDITDGANGAPDAVTVLYGGTLDKNVDFSDVALFREDKENAGKFYSYQGRALLMDDWVVLGKQGGDCELRRVKSGELVSGKNTLNQIEFDTPPTEVTSGNLLYLGDQPQRATWSVSGNGLLRTESFSATSSTISDGVVDIQAQYGLVDGTKRIWQSEDPADWSQVRAVKVAFLVRSKQFEKTDLYVDGGAEPCRAPACTVPVWYQNESDADGDGDGDGDGKPVRFVMSNLADGTDWRRYRYEVFERVIPLRNVIWGAQP